MASKSEKCNIPCLVLPLACIALLSLIAYSSLSACASQNATSPLFTDPEVKLAELSSQNFTQQLFDEATAYEPLLEQPGTQVHMGFWSGAGNHGSLVRVLDSINNYAPKQGESQQRAIWDEGTQSSLQYPSYVVMNAREHWYERASPKDGKALIYGVNYTDPYPVTFQQADQIWGAYSQRYTGMAVLIENATGNPVQAWCFVEGAKQNRIFYSYEYPELKKLEKQGIAVLHFAKSQDADWKDPSEWSSLPVEAAQPK